MKKLFILFLLALLPMVVSADCVKIDGIWYILNEKKAEVAQNGYRGWYSGKVVIPQTITYGGTKYDVTSIGVDAFSGCTGLTSVTIPSNVTSFCVNAFSGCTGLTSITIPNSVKNIGISAFSGCTGLTSVTIPNSVTEMESNVFENCSSLKKVTIGKGLTYISGAAFSGCTSLTSVTIPNNVSLIAYQAFYKCSGLTSVTIGNGVLTIGSSAFYGCSSLKKVTIPNNVMVIDDNAFADCSGLTSVSIGNSVISIGEQAFYGCKHLSSVTIGNGINIIRRGAFNDCTELTDFYCFAGSLPSTYDPNSNSTQDIFEGTPIEKATLHVLKDYLDIFNAEKPWKNFKTKVGMVPKVKLEKSQFFIEKGNTMTLTAKVTPSTMPDKSVTWESSNTKVATVTSKGKLKGIKAGTVTITCTSTMTGAKATCKVTVGYVKLDQTEVTLEKGKTVTLTANVYPSSLTDKSVTWTSSDTKVATVTTTGKVKGVKSGTATITCTSNATGLSTSCKVTVGKVIIGTSEVTIKKSRTVTLSATVYPSTLKDKSVTWKSSDTKIATVTSSGKVKGIKAGTAIITCTSVATGLSGTCTVTVLSTSESRSLDGDEDDEVSGIKNMDEALEPIDVYDLRGQKLLNQVTSLDGLPAGVYIVNGRKVLKK